MKWTKTKYSNLHQKVEDSVEGLYSFMRSNSEDSESKCLSIILDGLSALGSIKRQNYFVENLAISSSISDGSLSSEVGDFTISVKSKTVLEDFKKIVEKEFLKIGVVARLHIQRHYRAITFLGFEETSETASSIEEIFTNSNIYFDKPNRDSLYELFNDTVKRVLHEQLLIMENISNNVTPIVHDELEIRKSGKLIFSSIANQYRDNFETRDIIVDKTILTDEAMVPYHENSELRKNNFTFRIDHITSPKVFLERQEHEVRTTMFEVQRDFGALVYFNSSLGALMYGALVGSVKNVSEE